MHNADLLIQRTVGGERGQKDREKFYVYIFLVKYEFYFLRVTGKN